MTERKSKCPFAVFSAFGRKISGHGTPVAVAEAPASSRVSAMSAAPATPVAPTVQAACANMPSLEDELLAYRTLLRHASVVRGARGNLLILPSISLPSGDLADAPAAIRSWLAKVAKVPPAN